MAEANRTAAMATTYNEVDLKEVMALRSRRREAFKKKHGTDLGFMPFFVKAAVEGLRAFPSLNAEFQEEDLVLKRYYDIGIAVGLEDGLVVPVLRDAASKSFAEIESVIADMVQKAKDNRLSLEDLRGGTFTITNGGVFGSMWSTPLLNPPQTGILGLHRIEDRPVVREGQIVVRPMMYLALTYDHRVVDGREAVLCLARMKEVLEDPAAGLLGL
jgi:2-oxoglutarate dehydrogenase E2 component (dihydrolipoamide succinyltransferase)